MARPLAVVERRVAPLARVGAQQRQADLARFGVVMEDAEPRLGALLERVVEVLPIDRLLERVDIDALIRRVDVDALIGRVDVDGIVARVDIDGIVGRVDLQRIVADVLAGIEIGDLIHDSTNSIVTDARDTVRGGAASVDGTLARIVDRIVRRGRERNDVLPGYATPSLT